MGKKVLTLDELSIILIDKRTVRPEKEVLHRAKKVFGGRVVGANEKEGYNGTKPRSA